MKDNTPPSHQEFATCCAERRKQPILYKIEYSEAVAAAHEAMNAAA